MPDHNLFFDITDFHSSGSDAENINTYYLKNEAFCILIYK